MGRRVNDGRAGGRTRASQIVTKEQLNRDAPARPQIMTGLGTVSAMSEVMDFCRREEHASARKEQGQREEGDGRRRGCGKEGKKELTKSLVEP